MNPKGNQHPPKMKLESQIHLESGERRTHNYGTQQPLSIQLGSIMEILKINVWEKQVKDLNEDVKKLKEMVENRKILN